MPKGTRPKNTVRTGYDPSIARNTLQLNGRETTEGRARVAVGDRALAAAKKAPPPRAARTPTPPAAATAQPARRDALKDGVDAIRNNRERLRKMEEAQGLAEGGRVRGKKCSCGKKSCRMCGK